MHHRTKPAAGETPGRAPAAIDLEEVRRFLAEHVDSYEQLEALVYLARRPRRSWTPEEIATGTRLPTLAAIKALDELRRVGLVDAILEGRGTRFTFWPATPALSSAAEQFVAVYDANPVDVIHLMNQNALQRVRSSAAILFAEAFVLRRPRTGPPR
jgi:hypothetical protein